MKIKLNKDVEYEIWYSGDMAFKFKKDIWYEVPDEFFKDDNSARQYFEVSVDTELQTQSEGKREAKVLDGVRSFLDSLSKTNASEFDVKETRRLNSEVRDAVDRLAFASPRTPTLAKAMGEAMEDLHLLLDILKVRESKLIDELASGRRVLSESLKKPKADKSKYEYEIVFEKIDELLKKQPNLQPQDFIPIVARELKKTNSAVKNCYYYAPNSKIFRERRKKFKK